MHSNIMLMTEFERTVYTYSAIYSNIAWSTQWYFIIIIHNTILEIKKNYTTYFPSVGVRSL